MVSEVSVHQEDITAFYEDNTMEITFVTLTLYDVLPLLSSLKV